MSFMTIQLSTIEIDEYYDLMLSIVVLMELEIWNINPPIFFLFVRDENRYLVISEQQIYNTSRNTRGIERRNVSANKRSVL
jgi:hypothetical protein